MADYPISNVPRRVQYVNSGVGPYAFAFEVLTQTDIAVYRGSTKLTLTTDYTVTINANGTGSVTLVAAGTGNITIVGARAIQRSSDYTTGGDLFASTLNTDLDSQTIFSQQLAEDVDLSIKVPVYAPSSTGLTVNPEANKVLGWDSTGTSLINIDAGTLATIATYATAYADVFVSNGVTVAYTLTRNPGSIYNLDISTDGVTQEPIRDYTLSGSVVTFTSAMPINSRIVIKYKEGLPNVTADSQDIRYLPAGTGAVTTTVQTKLRQTVSVKDFGAVGNGIANDTSAIQAAITATGANTLYFPAGTYLITSTLTQPQSQSWLGEGGQRATTIKKGFNGSLMIMGTLGEINNLTFNGDGANFTGKNIVVPAGCFSPKIKGVRCVNSTEQGLFFEANAGGGACVDNFEGDTTAPLVVAAIGGAGDTTAVPRFFNNLWLSGGMIAINGFNDTFINNLYCHHIVFSSTTANAYISNTRFASGGTANIVQGAGIQFSNCAFAGEIQLQNTSGVVFDASCEFGFGIVENTATCLFNSFVTQSIAYTPTWTQASGTQPVLGNGTIVGRYIRNNRSCQVQIILTMGSTTTFGNGATAYLFSLPWYSHNAYTQQVPLVAVAFDSSASLSYTLNAQVAASENTLTLNWNGQGARDGFPVVWAAGDTITLNFIYSTK